MEKYRTKLIFITVLALCITIVSFYSHWQKMNIRQKTLVQPPDAVASVVAKERSETEKFVIYISGAVNQPGVYKIANGTRVLDAVNLAGGLTPQADVDKINLAKKLKDGMHVHVAEKKIKISTRGKSNSNPTQTGNGHSQIININTAGQEELDKLPGVGPALAQKIIIYRQEHGRFNTFDDLLKVPGIGPAKLARLRDKVIL